MDATTDRSEKLNITFITSNKGQPLLALNGFLYKCNKKTAKKKYWVCISNGCKINVHTDPDDTYLCGGTAEHNHESNPEMVTARQVRHQIKERAVNEIIPIAIIYEQELSKMSVNSTTMAILPTFHEIGPSIAKARRKVVPLLPQTCSFDIPDDYKTTIDGKRFLLSDELMARRERVLIFSSDRQLDLLFHSPIVYMDGTFSKSPPHFIQIYIIHAIFFDICVPCVYCLLVNKKSATYRHIFSELKQMACERGGVFAPLMVMTDFESGVIPVIRSEFPTAKHVACFFHYCQAIHRQITSLGMKQDYLTDDCLRTLCRKIMALALMPHEQVVHGFNEIRAAADELGTGPVQDLLEYFEKNWLDNIELWNVSKCDTRTNNICEGYHSRLNSRIYRHHPNIWTFIKFLQNEEKRVQYIVIQWSAGATRRKNTRTTAIQHRINTLYNRFSNKLINAADLLTGLSYVVAKKAN